MCWRSNERLNEPSKYSILLPKGERVSSLIIQQCHIRCAHGGTDYTLNELRSSGYWITSCNAAFKSLLFKCVKCCRLGGRLGEQKMADISVHRPAEAPPFTYCEVDMFGPFVIKQQRNEIHHYGAMFTCMANRAMHIEIIHSLDSNCFIQAFRRVVSCRRNIKVLHSDKGTNFVGYANKLKKAYKKMDNEIIQFFMENLGGDLVRWIQNPPAASHMGGVWERQIRSAHAILSSLLSKHVKSLEKESLLTLAVKQKEY